LDVWPSAVEDQDTRMIDASHLFPCHTTWIGFRRTYMRDFIGLFAPHLTPARIDSASWLNACLKHK